MRVYLVQHGESKPEEEVPQRSLTDAFAMYKRSRDSFGRSA